MDIKSIIDKLNNMKNNTVDSNDFFTTNEKFNDDFSFDNSEPIKDEINNSDTDISEISNGLNTYNDIEPDNETTSLVTVKERHLFNAQAVFKKSIRVSLKSFLISISISFLNLFI